MSVAMENTSGFRLNLNHVQQGDALIRIYDLFGRIVYQTTTKLQEGNNSLILNIGECAAGVYTVTLLQKNVALSRKAVIVR